MKHVINKAPLLVLLILFICFSRAEADDLHYKNILIGDRASGMGGAYTAVSDDASGVYYNPAGIVYASGRSLSASVNAYHNYTKEYDNVIGGKPWKRESSSLLPNFFGIIQPISDNVMLGLSYAVPDSMLEDQDQKFYNPTASVSRYIINFNNQETTYNVGPTLAIKASKDFAVGLTLYYHQKDGQYTLNQLTNLNTGQYEWSNLYYESHEQGVRPILGIMWSPIEKVSVGLTVSKVFLFSSDTEAQKIFKDISYDGNTITRLDYKSNKKRDYPYHITGGIAYFPTSDFLIDLDLSYTTADGEYAPLTYTKKTVWVVNGALGAEYYLNSNWAVRGGVFSNMSNAPDLKSGTTNQPEKIDMYGISTSISHFSKNTSITLGGSYGWGKGEAQVIGGSTNIQDVQARNWSVFLSSSYSY